MADPKLRATGTLLVALGVLGLAAGIVSLNVSGLSGATSIESRIGLLFLLVGAIAWILGRVGRETSWEVANPRLRSLGFLLLMIGILAAVAGILGVALTELGTPLRDVSQAAYTAGSYGATAGVVIVAISHRVRVHPTSPSVSER